MHIFMPDPLLMPFLQLETLRNKEKFLIQQLMLTDDFARRIISQVQKLDAQAAQKMLLELDEMLKISHLGYVMSSSPTLEK